MKPAPAATLKRGLSLPLATLYGLGTTIGAGVFALIGKVAGHAGLFAPISFLVAAALAAFTAFSFAELCARYPYSAGEAVYVEVGLRSPTLALIIGLLVIAAGCASAAAIVNGAAGYVRELIPVPRGLAILALTASLGLLAIWGIRESVIAASLLTVIEIAALACVIVAAAPDAAELKRRIPATVPPMDIGVWHGIFLGALLAFYAFIGFEDMVNVAEEVRDVQRNLPLAIVLTLVITTSLYLALAVVCVLAVPPPELAASEAPMALIFARSTGASPVVISLISLLALLNGALIQIIMVSRILYGLSRRQRLHPTLGKVHPRTHTPIVATVLGTVVVLVLALWFPIAPLAQATSLVMLVVFATVNLALWQLKRREPAPAGVPVFPAWVPAIGFVISAGFAVTAALEVFGVHRLGQG